jgi:feruloyl esterase
MWSTLVRAPLALAALLMVSHALAADGKCAGLARLKLQGVKIEAARSAGPDFTLPHTEMGSLAGASANVVSKQFCRVTGVIAPAIKYEVWLPPATAWNGKLLGVGNGGMAGEINYLSLKSALESGFATVSSNLGHDGSVIDGSFAIHNPEAVVDWGYRATHEMTVVAKAMLAAYYTHPQQHAYFIGCSGGGRQGLIEAQRYPHDYNGILAGDPTIDFTRLTTGGRLWGQLAMLRDAHGAGYIPAAKIPHIAAAVVAACDALDGIQDDVLDDPRQCRFDPASLKCAAEDRDDCLTDPQIAALKKIYAGATTSAGQKIYPGYMPGGEMGPMGWAGMISGKAPFQSGQWVYAKGFVTGMVFENAAYDPMTFDFDTDIARMENKPIGDATFADVINGMNIDLSGFRKAGGKLIVYHGWSDPGVSPLSTVDYYDGVVAAVGGRGALRNTQKFFRLFMAPGMQHCFGGPGPNAFGGPFQPSTRGTPDNHDALKMLEKWVEHGDAPDKIIATKYIGDTADKGALRTRPLCPYPKVAKFKGTGDTDHASHFACDDP